MQEVIGTQTRRNQDWRQVILSYVQLTKPRIILLLLFTTAGSLWMAAQGQLDPKLAVITLLSGTMSAGAANTINCLYDRDIDQIMVRTQTRPIPSGRVSPRDALIFAIVMATSSFVLLATFANLLSASLSMLGIFFYVVVYTHWLKRHSTQNIVIGGIAGAIPPLVGWAAVTGDLGWPAWVLFGLIFLWTPPHFWALALMIRDDYAKVGVPMLPVIEGSEVTAKQIFAYTLTLLPVSLLLVYPFGVMGAIYSLFAIVLGVVFVQKAWELLQSPADLGVARSVFKYSIVYMLVLCVGMVLDSLPTTQALVANATNALIIHGQSIVQYLPYHLGAA
jgi:heme o synthase